MRNCSTSVAHIVKGDKFNLSQCPKNSLELESMKNIPFAFAVGSLVYLEVCTKPDIVFAVGMLERYQSNPGIEHWTLPRKLYDISREQRTTCLHIESPIIWI